jgi:hypothetical protein
MKRARLAYVALTVLVGVWGATAEPTAAPAPSPDRAYIDAVVDGLVRAGALTRQQADEIKANAGKVAAEAARASRPAAPAAKPKPSWYDTLRVGGYLQSRWQYHPDATSGTASNEFLVRRARTKFDFEPTDRTLAEIEAEWGQEKPLVKNAFLDYYLTPGSPWRVRFGQAKVPFGFETPQSTGAIVPFEPSWLSQREFLGGYDTGLVVFYTREADRPLFELGRKAEYGPGDYGSLAVGFLNGQGTVDPFSTAGKTGELNSNKHFVARFARPFAVGTQARYAEVGASYYNGRYSSTKAGAQFNDNLLGLHGYLSPHPLGLQAEYYTGETEGATLRGWYAMGLWRATPRGLVFSRYDSYTGRSKGGGTAPFDRHRTGIGYAHQLDERTRLTAEYDVERDPGDAKNDLFGLQLMLGY